MKRLIIIAAKGKNNELGRNNELIWRIKEDLRYFKEVTEFHTIVMGRKTYESLPHMLPNRRHVVLSSSKSDNSDIVWCKSIDELSQVIEKIDDDVFIIGGASLYQMFLSRADELILTEIDLECLEADAYFPDIDEDDYDIKVINDFSNSEIPYLRKIYYKK